MAELTEAQLDEMFGSVKTIRDSGGDLNAITKTSPTEGKPTQGKVGAFMEKNNIFSPREMLRTFTEGLGGGVPKGTFSRENMGRGVPDAMKGGLPPLATLQSMIDAEENGTKVPAGAGSAGSFSRGSMFGLDTVLNAGINQLGDLLSGDDRSTFVEDFEQGNEVVSKNGNIIAELVGAVSPVGVASLGMKGIEKGIATVAPMLGEYLARRGVAPSLARAGTQAGIATAEGGLYALGTGGSVEDIKNAALMSGLFGGSMQIGADVIGPVLKKIATGIGNRKPDTQAARKLLSRLEAIPEGARLMTTRNGEKVLDVDAIRNSMGDSTASIIEMYPQAVIEDVMKHLDNPNANVQIALRPVREFVALRRESADPKFRAAMDAALGSPELRSKDMVANAARVTRQELQPQYDAALSPANLNPSFRGPNGEPINVSKKALTDIIKETFAGQKNVASAMDVRDQLLGRVIGNNYTPTDLIAFRQELDNAIFGGKIRRTKDFADLTSIEKSIRINSLIPLRAQLNDYLHNMAPGLRQLDETYAGEGAYEQAYEAGASLFGSNKSTSDAFDLYQAMPGRTPSQLAGLLEGAKASMVQALDGKSPQQINDFFAKSSNRVAKLDTLLGPEGLDKLQKAAQELVATARITKALDKNIPAEANKANPLSRAIDSAALIAAPTGALGTTFLAGALRREGGEAVTATGGRGLTSAIADTSLSMMPADASAKKINEMLMADMPGLAKFLPGMAAVGGNQ
tara:strand:- start:4575 stop:6806 length:2232 start_codon:yes stop_codon:yes gene_type:complete